MKRKTPFLTRFFYLLVIQIVFWACTPGKEAHQTAIVPDSLQLFQLLPSDSTGITFTNLLKENSVVNYFNTKYIYNGGGVAIGDINNDGLSDVYFSSNIFSNELYLNKGNFKFENISRKAGVEASRGFKTGVAMVDLNADGWQDIFVCRSNHPDPASRSNFVYINNGDLTFTEMSGEMGLADSAYSTQPHFLDYDRDGDIDIYVVNHPSDFESSIKVRAELRNGTYVRRKAPDDPINSDRLYQNNGDGTFKDVSRKAGIWNHAFGLSACVVDINQDQWPDIYVANDFVEPDFLYINNRNGTFTESWEQYFRHTASNSMGSDFADVDNDGLEDAIVVDMLPEDNQRQKQSSTTMILDRYEMLLRYGYQHQLMRNVLQRNNGNGTFSDVAQWAGVSATDWSWAPLFADFDNDGWKDLFISNGIRKDVTDLDYISFKQDSIEKSDQMGVSYVTKHNFKEWVDRMPSMKIKNYVFKNQGDFLFANRSNEWGLTDVSFSNGTAYGDLDNDGDLDLVVNNMDQKAFVYKNTVQETKRSNFIRLKLANNSQPVLGSQVEVFAGRQKQVSTLRTSRGYLSSVEEVLHFGLGSQSIVDSIRVYWPDGTFQQQNKVQANQLITLNYRGTKRLKENAKPAQPLFRKANGVISHRHKENDFNDFKSEALLPHAFSRSGPAMAAADVNGDGLHDLFIGGAMNQQGVLFVQQSDGTFKQRTQRAFELHAAHEDTGVLFFDADGDHDQDLYVVSGGNERAAGDTAYQDRLYVNDGRGLFEYKSDALPMESSSGSCVVAADYDRDGDLDLFVGGNVKPSQYPYADKSFVLRNNGKGNFTDVTPELTSSLDSTEMVSTAQWADMNSDGFPDLVVAGEWSPISIYINEKGRRLNNATSSFGLSDTKGWWTKIVIADLNKDGQQDIVAGNWGKNILVKASKDEPLAIYAKDFDDNGSLDPIICHFMQHQRWPLPRREVLVSQIPMLKKKFVKFHSYAQAKIENMFSHEVLESAYYREATTLATSVFISRGKGFDQLELPMDAQLSPVYAIAVEDYDLDGRPDILLAGNDFNPQIEEGVCDSGIGVFLKGDGSGKFIPMRIVESGFFAPGNVRSIITIQGGKRRLSFVANNNGPLEVFSSENPVSGRELIAQHP